MKSKSVFTIIISAIFVLGLINSNVAFGQSKEWRDLSKNIEEYYYSPVKNGDYVFTVFKEKIDFDSVEDETLGSVILGGIVLSYDESRSGDYVGVIVINTNNEAVAMSVDKKVFKKYMKGNITADKMLAEVERITIDMSEYPEFTPAASTYY